MAKKVELTWKTQESVIVVEECMLIDEDDPVYIASTGEVLSMIDIEGVGTHAGMLMAEMVVFEDDVGLFGVPPENVIYIKALD